MRQKLREETLVLKPQKKSKVADQQTEAECSKPKHSSSSIQEEVLRQKKS